MAICKNCGHRIFEYFGILRHAGDGRILHHENSKIQHYNRYIQECNCTNPEHTQKTKEGWKMGLDDLKLGDWLSIYECLDSDGHLSTEGKNKMYELKERLNVVIADMKYKRMEGIIPIVKKKE